MNRCGKAASHISNLNSKISNQNRQLTADN
jgi:hypothetical protein